MLEHMRLLAAQVFGAADEKLVETLRTAKKPQ